MIEAKPIRLANWKSEFKSGEVFVLKGHGFYIAQISRRGLILKRVKQPKKEQT